MTTDIKKSELRIPLKEIPRYKQQIIGRTLALCSKSIGYSQDIKWASIFGILIVHFSHNELKQIFGDENKLEQEKKCFRELDRMINILGNNKVIGNDGLTELWKKYLEIKKSNDEDWHKLYSNAQKFVHKVYFSSGFIVNETDKNLAKNISRHNIKEFFFSNMQIDQLRLDFHKFIIRLMQHTNLAEYTITNKDYDDAQKENPHLEYDTRQDAMKREMANRHFGGNSYSDGGSEE